jgi:hypothetical protein
MVTKDVVEPCARRGGRFYFAKIAQSGNFASDPCIMPGMELAKTKIPYLPPDWTVARGARYVAKLGVFILIPGLHQIACKRWILGALLMVIYLAAEFNLSNIPFNFSNGGLPTRELAWNISDLSLYFCWVLLALDARKIELRKLNSKPLLIISCAAGIYFVPDHNPGTLNIQIVEHDFACPTWCMYDIVEYQMYDDRVHKLSAGDHVVLGNYFDYLYVAELLIPGSPEEACSEEGIATRLFPAGNIFCQKILGNDYLYKVVALGAHAPEHTTIGDPPPELTTVDGRKVTIYTDSQVFGVELKKVGNTRQYFVFTDSITDFIGRVLLSIYEMTDVNLFGLSK